jgi:hypothetical protein
MGDMSIGMGQDDVKEPFNPNLPADCTEIYRAEQLLEAILKIKSNNYSGNELLSWGQIRL